MTIYLMEHGGLSTGFAQKTQTDDSRTRLNVMFIQGNIFLHYQSPLAGQCINDQDIVSSIFSTL